MSLCLMNVHGDIEGDYEFVCDIPNGTNGEVIQALFPNPHIDTKSHTVWVGHDAMSFTREWWNAPYKAERGEQNE